MNADRAPHSFIAHSLAGRDVERGVLVHNVDGVQPHTLANLVIVGVMTCKGGGEQWAVS